MIKKIKFASLSFILACVISAIIGGGVVYLAAAWLPFPGVPVAADGDGHDEGESHGDEAAGHGAEDAPEAVELPKPMWESARLKIAPVQQQSIAPQAWVTGKVMLNEDRTAEIYSITEGRAHFVPVSLGDRVEENQLLAVIDSREVGSAKLELLQARLQQDFAQREYEFAQQVKGNAIELITQLESGKSLDQINQALKDKPIGDYREQLLGAYTQFVRAKADYDRLRPIAASGAIAGKQLIEAEAAFNTAKSAFDAVLEQLQFAIPQDTLESEQQLRQAEQAVDVAKAKLNILGYSNEGLAKLKPDEVSDALSHYEVRAPFAGTVIDKNVVLAERVGTDTMMFRIADLSTVWIQADIYQKDLYALQQLGGTLRFRAPSGSDGAMHTHEVEIFYRGDVIDPETRTLRLRAIAENDDRHLKPGMFVEVEIPTEDLVVGLAVPESAIQELDGENVVFVQAGETSFKPRPVTVGEAAGGMVQILAGLEAGDRVVVSGAFALKSEMLKGEISHGH